MIKRLCVILGTLTPLCSASEPYIPIDNSLPFLVYYTSRYRGMCMGHLVARTVIMTAAVCVSNPKTSKSDRRPITVVVGASYRHARHGIRIVITRIVIPKMPRDLAMRENLLQKSPAMLMMKLRVPDILVHMPLRALDLDWKGEIRLREKQECFLAGWHFFFKEALLLKKRRMPPLQRHLHVQSVKIVNQETCADLIVKLEPAFRIAGYRGSFDRQAMICVADPNSTAQACHAMYGAPLVCGGRAVGMLMAPDAQWSNCAGFSNVVHLFRGSFIRDFMQCVSNIFEPEMRNICSPAKKKEREVKEVNDDNYDHVHYNGENILGDDDDC